MMEGSCLCGSVRYQIQASKPLFSVMCHCNNCQKLSGSAFSQNLFCDQEARRLHILPSYTSNLPQGFEITSGKDLVREYKDTATESGQPVLRHFCSKCGCPLFVLSDENPMMKGKVVLMSGSLSDAVKKENPPMMEFYCRAKRDWVGVPAERQELQGGSA